MDPVERVLSNYATSNYVPSRRRLIGDANILNGRVGLYQRKGIEIPKDLKTARAIVFRKLNGAGLYLSSSTRTQVSFTASSLRRNWRD